MSELDRMVVKLGSNCNVEADGLTRGRPNHQAIVDHCTQLAPISRTHRLAIVISGAVALGERIVSDAGRTSAGHDSQSLASVGNPTLFGAYQQAFGYMNVMAGQALVSHQELEDPDEGGMFERACHGMWRNHFVPMFNENDFLELRELKALDKEADNDHLAAHIATKLGATTLLFLTSGVNGFEVDKEVVPKLSISQIEQLNKHDFGKSDTGQGGIFSKLENAARAVSDSQTGLRAFIGNAAADYQAILAGEIGTEVVQ